MLRAFSALACLTLPSLQQGESDDEDDGLDDVLLQHQNLMRSSSAYSLGSLANPAASPGQFGYGYAMSYAASGGVPERRTSLTEVPELMQPPGEGEVAEGGGGGGGGGGNGSGGGGGAGNGGQGSQLPNWSFLGLQRGTSIVGDPGECLLNS